MKIKNIIQKEVKIALLAGCLMFSFQSCELLLDSKRNGIIWHDEDLNEFVLYAFGPGEDVIYVVDLVTGEILRELTDFKSIISVVATDDGRRLYVSTYIRPDDDQGLIYEVDTQTWERREIYYNASHLLTNRRGNIYFITKIEEMWNNRIFGRIYPTDGSVVELGTINVEWGFFRDDSSIEIHPYRPLVYAVDGEGKLYRYDYSSNSTSYVFPELSFLLLVNITLSGGGDTLYIPGGPVLDLVNEEIIGSIPVWRLGWPASRRDNKEVYITDPGGYAREPFPSGKVFVYSPVEDRIISEINAQSLTDRISLTPKDRYAVVINWANRYNVIDLKRRRLAFYHTLVDEDGLNIIFQNFYLSRRAPGL
jgi:hypothetical protein